MNDLFGEEPNFSTETANIIFIKSGTAGNYFAIPLQFAPKKPKL